MTNTATATSLLVEVQSDRGLECLVYDNRDTWLPDITDLEQRSAAAIAYVQARRAGIDRPEARDLARAAIGDDAHATAERLTALRAQAEAKRQAEATARAEREAAAAAKEAEFKRRFAVACDLNRHDLKTVLKAAMKHTECSRWTGNGWKRSGSWSLIVRQQTAADDLAIIDVTSVVESHRAAHPQAGYPHLSHARWLSLTAEEAQLHAVPRVVMAANESTYQALVSILGRRSWNQGGCRCGCNCKCGRRHDVTAETPNDPKLVALAKSIIARKRVAPKKLMAIADTHARAWAVEQTGGWGRMAKLMSVVEKTKEGTLLNGVPAGLDSDLLLVTCPSTGSRYALMVPRPPRAKSRTVKNALKAVNGLDSKNIVAQS